MKTEGAAATAAYPADPAAQDDEPMESTVPFVPEFLRQASDLSQCLCGLPPRTFASAADALTNIHRLLAPLIAAAGGEDAWDSLMTAPHHQAVLAGLDDDDSRSAAHVEVYCDLYADLADTALARWRGDMGRGDMGRGDMGRGDMGRTGNRMGGC
jgi:hypothetical protein